MTNTETTRRTLVAGLTVAPLAGVPAVTGAVSAAPMCKALAQAFERHKAAQAAYDAHADTTDDDFLNGLGEVEWGAFIELVEAPCANDAELLQKLRYLHAYEKKLAIRQEFEMTRDGSIVVALDLHFDPEV